MASRDPLLDRIAALWRARDPMPADLPDRVLARLATDAIDLEYELLTLASRSDAALGARAGNDTQVLLEFRTPGCTVLMRVTAEGGTRRIDGWCEPAELTGVTLTRDGATWTAEVRSASRFVLTGIPPGLCRLDLVLAGAPTARRLRTPQVEI